MIRSGAGGGPAGLAGTPQMLLSQQKKSRSTRLEEPACRGPGSSMYCAKRREKRWRSPTHERRPARSRSVTNAIRLDAVTRQYPQNGRLPVLSMSGRHADGTVPAVPAAFATRVMPADPAPVAAADAFTPAVSFPRSRRRSRRRAGLQPASRRDGFERLPQVLLHDRYAKRRGVHRGIGPNSYPCPHPVHDVSATRVRSGAQPRGRAAAARRRYAVPAADARRSAADSARLGVALQSASRVPEHRARFCQKS